VSATKGKRNPALLLPSPQQEAGSARSWLVVGRRPIKHGDRTYLPGETFPDNVIGRVESWIRTGMLVRMS
jgi:hypothetical protein